MKVAWAKQTVQVNPIYAQKRATYSPRQPSHDGNYPFPKNVGFDYVFLDLRRRATKRPATNPAIPRPSINKFDGSGTGVPPLLPVEPPLEVEPPVDEVEVELPVEELVDPP
ncbi:MAG: hypothetical protein Pars2KO_23380 [Parasphingorhabdus sp.]